MGIEEYIPCGSRKRSGGLLLDEDFEGESYYVAEISDIAILHVLIMRTCHRGKVL